MDYNSFSEGIEPGGLTQKSDIKLLVCFLLRTLDRAVTKTRLNEILQEHSLANYFETNQAISELLRSGKITSDLQGDDEYISLVPAYSFSTAEIEGTLPRSVREKALSSALRLYARDKSESENEVTIEECGKGYTLTFGINDEGAQLMKLSLYIADEQQAQKMKDNFLDDPAGLYGMIIASLTIE